MNEVNIYFGGVNPHDKDLECVCDRCDVKITEEEKAYVTLEEIMCKYCWRKKWVGFLIYLEKRKKIKT